jgi:hypothetical protein
VLYVKQFLLISATSFAVKRCFAFDFPATAASSLLLLHCCFFTAASSLLLLLLL